MGMGIERIRIGDHGADSCRPYLARQGISTRGDVWLQRAFAWLGHGSALRNHRRLVLASRVGFVVVDGTDRLVESCPWEIPLALPHLSFLGHVLGLDRGCRVHGLGNLAVSSATERVNKSTRLGNCFGMANAGGFLLQNPGFHLFSEQFGGRLAFGLRAVGSFKNLVRLGRVGLRIGLWNLRLGRGFNRPFDGLLGRKQLHFHGHCFGRILHGTLQNLHGLGGSAYPLAHGDDVCLAGLVGPLALASVYFGL